MAGEIKKLNIDGTEYKVAHEGELKNSGFEVVSALPTSNLFNGRVVHYKGYNWVYSDVTTPKGWKVQLQPTDIPIIPEVPPVLETISSFANLKVNHQHYQLNLSLTNAMANGTKNFDPGNSYSNANWFFVSSIMNDADNANAYKNFKNAFAAYIKNYANGAFFEAAGMSSLTKGQFIATVNLRCFGSNVVGIVQQFKILSIK